MTCFYLPRPKSTIGFSSDSLQCDIYIHYIFQWNKRRWQYRQRNSKSERLEEGQIPACLHSGQCRGVVKVRVSNTE